MSKRHILYWATLLIGLVIAANILVCFFLGCLSITPENTEVLTKSSKFIRAVEQNDFPSAFALLSEKAQAQIEYAQFASTPGDFQGTVEAFSSANPAIPTNTRLRELVAKRVFHLRGQKGVITFVFIQQNRGEWQIINILEEKEWPPKSGVIAPFPKR